jgi:hypothetical protein
MLFHRDPRLRQIDAEHADPQLHAKRDYVVERIKDNGLLLFTIAMLAAIVFFGAILTANP